MTVKSGVWKPTAGEQQKQLAGSCEVTNLKLAAGSGAAVVSFYNGTTQEEATPANLLWVLDASTTDVDSDKFDGLEFPKGVFAVCEQGINFNPIVCIATRKYTN